MIAIACLLYALLCLSINYRVASHYGPLWAAERDGQTS